MLRSDDLWQCPRDASNDAGTNELWPTDSTGVALPHRRDAPETSIDAAHNAAATAPSVRARLLDAIRAAGPSGLTNDEAAALLGAPIQSVGPRCLDLREAGLVVDGGDRRPTRWGRAAIVWVAVEHAPGGEGGRE
ncbi:MAG: hypothetical protein ACTS3F_02665 [Phycisphaerales bacterium]